MDGSTGLSGLSRSQSCFQICHFIQLKIGSLRWKDDIVGVFFVVVLEDANGDEPFFVAVLVDDAGADEPFAVVILVVVNFVVVAVVNFVVAAVVIVVVVGVVVVA